MEKEFLTREEILKHLIEVKKVDKETIDESILDEEAYINLVKPYSPLIASGRNSETSSYIYSDNNNFNSYLKCKKVDNALCVGFRVILGCFERRLKCFIANKFSIKMANSGDKQTKDFSWIDRYIKGNDIFDLTNIALKDKVDDEVSEYAEEKEIESRKNALLTIQNLVNDTASKKNAITIHYKSEHHYIPFYIAVLNLSLGELVALFSMLNYKDKEEFIQMYKGSYKPMSPIKVFKYYKDFKRFTTIRNISSHYDTLVAYFLNTIEINKETGKSKISKQAFLDFTRELIANYKRSKTVGVELPSIPLLDIPYTSYSFKNITNLNELIRLFNE